MLTGFGLLYFIISSTRVTLIIAIILIPILLIDTSLVKIYDFIVSLSDSLNLFIAFILIVCTFILGQFSLLRFVGNRINDRKDELVLSNHIHKIVSILQYCLSGILLFIIFQIIFISHYDTFLLESVVVISPGSSIIALGLLTSDSVCGSSQEVPILFCFTHFLQGHSLLAFSSHWYLCQV